MPAIALEKELQQGRWLEASFTWSRTWISILVIPGNRIVWVERDTWLATLRARDVVDSVADAGNRAGGVGDIAGDRTASRETVKYVHYMLENVLYNSGHPRYAPSVDPDGYLAGCAHRWMAVMALGMTVVAMERGLHRATWQEEYVTG
jgi:hypothetical protein